MVSRASNTQLLSFFTDLKKFDRLNLEPIWQRKPGVWTLNYKRYFIDSILRNYPFPTILLNARTSEDGTTIYEVVDGKQRLTTIFEFMNDEFTTSAEYSDDLGAPQFFSDMPSEAKKAFYEYQVTVEVISHGSLEQLREAFDRLNRNVARLNSQELRHARFSGRFIQLMEGLADDEFWSEVGIATPARTRRMLDVQFVSQVFILTMHGVQDGDEAIDQFYADYDEDIPSERLHRRTYNVCKTIVQELQETHGLIRNSRYGNLADLYSLWAAVRDVVLDGNAKGIDYDTTASNLQRFAEEVGSGKPLGEAAKYLVAARQGSNKGANRTLRRDTLRRLIVLRQ
jgi:hypothetical protein